MKTLITTTLMMLCFVSLPAHAVKIQSVKDKQALLETEGDQVRTGDRFYAVSSDGKKRAILQVKQVRGDRALAVVLRGRALLSHSLEPYTARGGRKASGSSNKGWGLTAGYSSNSMTVKPNSTTSISLSGSSFNLSGFYQLNLDGKISARILGGYEALVASGTSATCSGECKVDIGYLGVEALVRYSFINSSSMEFWGGAGLGFLFAMNKTSNILNTSKISTNQTIVGALGLDYKLSRSTFIPLQLDYALYPENSTSSATQIILRAGWGRSF